MDIFGGRIMENFFENLLSNGELQKENARLKSCLQEIKKIAETELSYDMVGNEHRHYKNYDIIRQLITKAEEE